MAQMLTLEQNNEELLGAKVSNINNPGVILVNMLGKCRARARARVKKSSQTVTTLLLV